MGTSLAMSCVRLETVKEKEERKSYMIRNKFRSVLLAFQKGIHKAKKVLTTRKEENKRDWAELNIELLHLISKKMENISNFIIFRAVCKNWRLATDPTDAPAQFQPPDTIKHISIIIPKPTSFGYYKGRLFLSLSIPKITWVYDATTGTKTSIEIPHPGEHVNFNFLIDAMGDLLGVMMSYIEVVVPSEVFQSLWKYQFEVYRLEHTDDFGCCRWSKLNGIGDRILFLQEYYNYGFCLRASDIKGPRGNYIYYNTKYWQRDCANGRFFRYDMEDGTTEQVALKSPDALWFLPSLY
ncbi:hypothetical protein FCM35_KLT19230 [Carex littledalei]|uniref:KIB1-4 beta-propeller domain-containing protein n=1 Tax=Carex littledalei TaxID=544730 RepID=A0A833VXI5_9POAL|nr:hypothetical protein FCM35_KLT19230 [Carex littledalei]